MSDRTYYSKLSDQELIIEIRKNSDALGVVYTRCKPNCLKSMRRKTNNQVSEVILEEVFQDACIVLYEKIVKGEFVLTTFIQNYLYVVCYNQLMDVLRKNKLSTEYFEITDQDDDENPIGDNSSITDLLDEIDNSNEPLFVAIEHALEIIRNAGGHCYELLIQFWYHRKKMDELAELFGYTNAANTKNQKARCQERLRVLAYNELKEIR